MNDRTTVKKSELERLRQIEQDQNNHVNLKLTDIEEWKELFGGVPNPSGVPVTESTAVKVTAVYACVRIIAGTISSLPIDVYKRVGIDEREQWNQHPVAPLLRSTPSPLMTSMAFWESIIYFNLLKGDGIALISRERGGQPRALTSIDPQRVRAEVAGGRVRYDIYLDQGEFMSVDQDDILHVPGLGFNGLKSRSVLDMASIAIGSALAQEHHAAEFFGNSARPDAVISFQKKVDDTTAQLIRNYWLERHQGIGKQHLPAVLAEGGEYKQLSLSARDSQLLESRSFQVRDIARWFGVPNHMIGETTTNTSWGTGLEQQTTGFVIYTLRPILKRIEQEINRKLLRSREFFTKFNLSGLVRGDIKTRHESYKVALGGNQIPGYLTQNEVRALENYPPIANGDVVYTPPDPAQAQATADTDTGDQNESDDASDDPEVSEQT